MAYGEQVREEMKAREAQLRNFFSNVDVAMRRATPSGPQKWLEEEQTLAAAQQAAAATVHARLLDSIDTRGAIDAVSDLIKAVNLYLAVRQDAASPPPQALLLRQCAAFVTKTLSVFGLAPSAGDALGMGDAGSSGSGDDAKAAAVLDAFCTFRDDMRRLARAAAPHKDLLACCDAVRDGTMADLGVRLEDLPEGGSVWKKEDPAVLRAEREEKAAAAAAAVVKKVRSKADAARREVEKFEKLVALPSIPDALGDKYSRFDPATEEPTHDAAGVALEGKALDKARKDFEKAKKVRVPLDKKVAEAGPGFLDDLRKEVEALEAQLVALEPGSGAAKQNGA